MQRNKSNITNTSTTQNQTIMNKMIQSAIFCCFALMACVLTSCEETVSMQNVYKFGLETVNAYDDDFLLITNYLESKGIKNDDTIITEGKSDEDCDAQAKKLFDEKVSKLSHTEIKAIVSESCSFTYTATRYERDNTTVVTIGCWSYPAK